MSKLKQVLAQEDTVLFIGSGISLWAGLPTWSGMINQLAKFVESSGGQAELIRAEAKRGDLLQAASYGFDKLTKQQIGEFIRSACKFGVAQPHDIHKKIVSLGPRCFVTTNYDDLIEQSLRKWQPTRFYRPVTNRHLTETAEIVHARAIDFIFKPHGDAGDSDSIILTREQYRQLLPQGERQAALESLKMLLASRPVVYFGFGLRDPDFIYVRDLLTNTYKGGTRDHYAIMADVSGAEIDYWRRNYGIHLINYTTTEHSDKSRNHIELSTLLDSLLEKSPEIIQQPTFNPESAEVLLSLARHASALSRTSPLAHEFSIRVHSVNSQTSRDWVSHDKFDHSSVESFLESGPDRAILIGLPGAGKTYSLRRAAARLADQLNQTCLAEQFIVGNVVIPIYINLKLYQGDICQLINHTLPSRLSFPELVKTFKVKLFLDSFNEMPREFLESGTFDSDIHIFLKGIGQASLIIGSRTADGLEKTDLPIYHLDQIDQQDVITELQRLGHKIEGIFSRETLEMLQRPFYFQYIASGAIVLPEKSHPRDFYRMFFDNISRAFSARFNCDLNLEKTLSVVAYDSLNRGEETFSIEQLLDSVKRKLDAEHILNIFPLDIINWLISRSVILPYSGGRISFVHQSITEYLAATELAHIYLNDPQTLKEKIALTRWDQALFLTLSLLPRDNANCFLQSVVQADFGFALNAAKYLEADQELFIAKLLAEVPKYLLNRRDPYNWDIVSAIQYRLPISITHEQELRAIIECGNSVGGAAVIRLAQLKGEQIKHEFLKLLFDKRNDFNFCANGVAVALKPFVSQHDISTVVDWADEIQGKNNDTIDENDIDGFLYGASLLFSDTDLTIIWSQFLKNTLSTNIPDVRTHLLCEILQHRNSTEALNFAADLLLRGVNQAATSIYFISSNGGEKLSWSAFNHGHVKHLLEIMRDDTHWVLKALVCLCNARKDLAKLVDEIASHEVGIAKASLLYCTSQTNLAPVFSALRELLTLSEAELACEPTALLSQIDLDWSEEPDLLVALLKLRDNNLANSILHNADETFNPNTLGIVKTEDLEWWLDWMLELELSIEQDQSWWLLYRLGRFLAKFTSQEQQSFLIEEFNKSESKYRGLLLNRVIKYFHDITTDAFREDTIAFMLADLKRKKTISPIEGHLLGSTATEHFVVESLQPLLAEAEPAFAANLHAVLKQAGVRHGRRYSAT